MKVVLLLKSTTTHMCILKADHQSYFRQSCIVAALCDINCHLDLVNCLKLNAQLLCICELPGSHLTCASLFGGALV